MVLDSLRPRLERLVAARYPERIEATLPDNAATIAAIRAGRVDAALAIFDHSFAVARERLDETFARTPSPGLTPSDPKIQSRGAI